MMVVKVRTWNLEKAISALPVPGDLDGAAEFKAGVAGSVPLGMLLSIMEGNKKNRSVPEKIKIRWNERKAGFLPNDIDYYVVDCEESVWRRVVTACRQKLDAMGVEYRNIREFRNAYSVPNAVLNTSDFEVPAWGITISIHHHSRAKSLAEVVDEYDLSVCKAIYYPGLSQFEYTYGTFEDISRKRMRCTHNVLQSFLPPPDVKRINKSLERISKYRNRGFKLKGNMMAMALPDPDEEIP